jgi:uncharacterized protein
MRPYGSKFPSQTDGYSTKVQRSLVLVVLVSSLIGAPGCQAGENHLAPVGREAPIVPGETGIVRVKAARDPIELSVEIARTKEQKSIGLMERSTLPEDQGMLFVYTNEQPDSAAFYMFRTLLPLDIAFVDSIGHIVEILQMEACTKPVDAWCERYAPAVPYPMALEVNQGLFSARDVGVGDRIMLMEIDG